MSDVDGILNGELYTDVIEMKNDWEDMLSFINKGLISQIVSPEEVPKTVSKDDPNLKVIKEKEQEMMDEYANLLKLKTINREIYLALSETDYGSEDYFKAVKEYDEVSRELENIEKIIY
ncbi:hypothetical protein QO179_24835 [Bacillus stercoris]|nr:hypothetical protein [Bacillus stercoris]